MTYDPTLLERLPKEVYHAATLVSEWFEAQMVREGSICGIGPVHDYQPVGCTAKMPGAGGFTIAVFNSSEIPPGTKLYVKE